MSTNDNGVIATAESWFTSGNNTLGMANAWSISLWVKSTDSLQGARKELWFHGGNVPTDNQISILTLTNNGPDSQLVTLLYDSAGVRHKWFEWDDFFGTAVAPDLSWHHIVWTWNGTDLLFYDNSVLTAPSTEVENIAGTMTDSPTRSTRWATGAAGSGNVRNWAGNHGHVGEWSSVLTQAEIDLIFAQKFAMELASDNGDYTSSATLQHWYRPGYSGLGNIDAGNGTAVDLIANHLGQCNIVEEVP
jgi:hypothetical protein